MIEILFIIGFGLFLAYSNGANDHFKGVATLFGSGTTTHRKALAWATLTTLAGSLVALLLSRSLLAGFSGKGLVPDSVVSMRSFSLAVPLAAALTVFLATRFGFPISTTHALTGALVGAGIVASPSGVNFSKLGSSFVAPLLVSPLVAIMTTVAIYAALHFTRTRSGASRDSCVCVGNEVVVAMPTPAPRLSRSLYVFSLPKLTVGTDPSCREAIGGKGFGIRADQVLDPLHFASSGVVSFARGLNDTPKIAALLMAGGAVSTGVSVFGVAIAMALGGILQSARIAEVMSHRVTRMTPDQGLTANLVTGGIVLFASKFGLPVSTTHVSCGALFGIGAMTRQAQWRTIAGILVAWVTTLPVAAILGALLFTGLREGMGL